MKQLSRSERQSFLEFAPDYFRCGGAAETHATCWTRAHQRAEQPRSLHMQQQQLAPLHICRRALATRQLHAAARSPLLSNFLQLRGHHAAPRAGHVPGQDPGGVPGARGPGGKFQLLGQPRTEGTAVPATHGRTFRSWGCTRCGREGLAAQASSGLCCARQPPWCTCATPGWRSAPAGAQLSSWPQEGAPRPLSLSYCSIQVSVQYTGGRGGPAGPAWGGKDGTMDLLVTENVFYGREAQARCTEA